MRATGLSPQVIAEKGLNKKTVWYVFNEDEKLVLTSPDPQANEYKAIIFLEKEDAEKARFILSKNPTYQDSNLSVQSDIFQSVFEDSVDYPEFTIILMDAEQAGIFFEDHEDILRTRKIEEGKPDIGDSSNLAEDDKFKDTLQDLKPETSEE